MCVSSAFSRRCRMHTAQTSHFDLVFIDNGIGTPGCRFAFDGGNNTMLECHEHRSRGAAVIKASRADTPVFVYRQISVLLEGVDLDTIAPLLVHHDDRGNAIAPGRLDWRQPEAVDWYVNNVIGRHTADDPAYDGVFIDGPLASSELCCSANMTLASKRSMMAGLASMLKKTSDLLSPMGKVLTVSLGSHMSNLTSRFYPPNSTAGGKNTPQNHLVTLHFWPWVPPWQSCVGPSSTTTSICCLIKSLARVRGTE